MNPVELSIVLNSASTVLFVVSLFFSNSISVQIGALNELTDTAGLIAMMVGLRRVRRTLEYPFGVERRSYATSLIALMIFSGSILGFAVNRVVSSLGSVPEVYSTPISLHTVLFSTVLNTVPLFYSAYYLARDKTDPVAKSTMVDSLADTLVGIISFIALYTGSGLVDVIGSIIITGVVVAISFSIGYRFYRVLTGHAPPKSVLVKVLNSVLSLREVKDVNVFKAAMLTEDEYLLVLEVEVDENMDVRRAEELANSIESRVKEVDPRFKYVYIEIVPARREPPSYKEIMSEITSLDE
ncbi:MAG: cation diffusion facilitator family transporter [Thermogladius sp.]